MYCNIKLFIIATLLISLSTQFNKLKNQTNDDQMQCYGLIFDAGSSSTKMLIYQWKCRDQDTVPDIIANKVDSQKAKPGLATFADDLDGINDYLQPLLEYADSVIGEDQRQYTPIMLYGTAGFRVIPEQDQQAIFSKVRDIFSQTEYLYKEQFVRIISGQEEGGFMWTSINYLLGNLNESSSSEQYTAVTIDLGGASTQIAFGPRYTIDNQFEIPVDFPNFNEYDIYSVSYLGYGNDLIRDTIINDYGTWSGDKKTVSTPCYYNGYEEQEDDVTIKGTGQPDICRSQIIDSFHLEDCSYAQQFFGCGINGTYQPYIPYSKKVYAVSGITTAASYFDLVESPYTPFTLQQKYTELCSKSWEEIQKEYPDNPYISTTCFLGLYSSALMIYGYNVDPERQVYSPDEINGSDISWTLGAMFYTVSQLPCSEESPLCQVSDFIFNYKYNIQKE